MPNSDDTQNQAHQPESNHDSNKHNTEMTNSIEESPSEDTSKLGTESSPDIYALEDLRNQSFSELYTIAQSLPIRLSNGLNHDQLVYEIARFNLSLGHDVEVEGVIEQSKDNFAMLRDPNKSFKTAPDDIYFPNDLIKKYNLKTGNLVKVRLRRLRPQDKYLSTKELISIEGIAIEDYFTPKSFESLTPLFPRERIILENKEENSASMRVIDLIAPLGKGQRGLVVAPPRGGKTILIKQMAKAIRKNHPEIKLIILLLDERPEEVTDFEETVDAPVYASTFDEPSRRHSQVSDLVIERAKRLVEQGNDVVILLDSLTRLARGYNANQVGGKIMSGGLGSSAMEKPRKFFGSARNLEEGGSLTIIATCLVETESRMDEVIFEEFKGTGNLEIKLDKELAERRIFPAIHVSQSATRNDDKLYHPSELPRIMDVRRQLAAQPVHEALEMLLNNIHKTQNNAEILLRGLR